MYRAHARPDETFVDLLRRFERTRSVRGGARELGVAKKTLYRWFDAYLVDFDRYSGRSSPFESAVTENRGPTAL
ncbi:hypothetical protein ACFQL4_23785 [Halosimplex aquaticum]